MLKFTPVPAATLAAFHADIRAQLRRRLQNVEEREKRWLRLGIGVRTGASHALKTTPATRVVEFLPADVSPASGGRSVYEGGTVTCGWCATKIERISRHCPKCGRSA
jgi:hypothetical protein